jgi:hypothetical protein
MSDAPTKLKELNRSVIHVRTQIKFSTTSYSYISVYA